MQTEKEKGLSIGSSKKKILIKYYYERIRRDVTNFIKWMLLAILTGLVVGGASSAFAACISAATEYRNSHLWVFLCLPLAGIVIVFMYERLGRQDGGTNQVLSTIKSKDNVPFISAPLIFISTLLTHLTGGSAGREGASIQFGGSIGSWLAKLVHLDETDHVWNECGVCCSFRNTDGSGSLCDGSCQRGGDVLCSIAAVCDRIDHCRRVCDRSWSEPGDISGCKDSTIKS